jgi:choline kinase
MFVNYNTDRQVTEISKSLQKQEGGQGKSIQIAKFVYDDKKILFERAKELSKEENVFYPAKAYDVLIQKKRFYAVDVAGDFSSELDTMDDYNSLTSKIK